MAWSWHLNTYQPHDVNNTIMSKIMLKWGLNFKYGFYFEFKLLKKFVKPLFDMLWPNTLTWHLGYRSTVNHISPSQDHLWKQHRISQSVTFTTELMIDSENPSRCSGTHVNWFNKLFDYTITHPMTEIYGVSL